MRVNKRIEMGWSRALVTLALGWSFLTSPAAAELSLSQLVVELAPDAKAGDVEIFNDSAERMFVVADPREILDPGLPTQHSRVSPDPAVLGLLVSPRRMILEPGQRRTLRVAKLKADDVTERIYRVTVKPVVGDVSASDSGLKLLVGYDLLVIARPGSAKPDLKVRRTEQEVVISNQGNASVELTQGKRCSTVRSICEPLPPKRLYAGATWQIPITPTDSGSYKVRTSQGWSELKF